MPTSYIVRCKRDASEDDIKAVKDSIISSGGTIEHEYTLIKGFSCTIPDDHVGVLSDHEHVDGIEKDQEIKTQ